MSQSYNMKKSIIKNVVPKIIEKDFYGKYPNYYRKYDDRLEMICFASLKYGNAIVVECSVVYLNESKENDNIAYHWYEYENKPFDINTISTAYCKKFYRLKGHIQGNFYYTDVYRDIWGYHPVGEKRRETYKKGLFGYRVQTADEHIYDKVCEQINLRMHKIYEWLEENKEPLKTKKKSSLKLFKKNKN